MRDGYHLAGIETLNLVPATHVASQAIQNPCEEWPALDVK